MAIAAADLIAPTGALTAELLTALRPGASSTAEAAQVYADAGTDKVAAWTSGDAARADRAAIAWATYRALSDRAQQINSAAAGLTAGDVSRSYAVGQAKELQAMADRYLAAYEVEAAAEAGGAVAASVAPLSSRSVPVTVVW